MPQRVTRAELIAEILGGKGQFSAARAALMEADQQQPTAEHAYRLGLLAQRAGDDSQAVDDYEQAVAADIPAMWRAFLKTWPEGRHRMDAALRGKGR